MPWYYLKNKQASKVANAVFGVSVWCNNIGLQKLADSSACILRLIKYFRFFHAKGILEN